MKNQPKKIFILLSFLLLSSNLIQAQFIGKRWAVVEDKNNKVVYLDTTSIRSLDNQLAFWSLTVYHEPQTVEPLTKNISRIKSQYLINSLANQYSVIGALYYDERGRIIGEASNPKSLAGRSSFAKPIDENPSIQLLMEKALAFISTGSLEGTPDEMITSDQIAFNLSLNKEVNEKLNKSIADNTDTNSVNRTDADISSSGQSDVAPLTPGTNLDIFVFKDSADDNQTIEQEEQEPDITKPQTPDPDQQTAPVNSGEYDTSKERIVTGTIFSDGNLYCVQISSWKRKDVAEREVRKLKQRGHNAYVVEAYIPSKRGTWYRVRIGYFNSLQEARNYQNNM